MEQPECEACGSLAVVVDSKEGNMVCSDCGVVMRQNMISTNSEYRNFSESDKPTGISVGQACPVLAVLLPSYERGQCTPRPAQLPLGLPDPRFNALTAVRCQQFNC